MKYFSISKSRNSTYDFMKLFGLSFVVLGHVYMMACNNYVDSYFFNFIWAIQMPLFMFVSGLFLKPQKMVNAKQLLLDVIKKFFLLIFPILSFCLFKSIIVLCQTGVFELKELFLNALVVDPMRGLWFLLALFLMHSFFNVTSYILNKFPIKESFLKPLLYSFIFLFLTIGTFSIIYLNLGYSYFASKYILYYSFFFVSGYIYENMKPYLKLKHIYIYMIRATLFVGFISGQLIFFPLFALEDNIKGIVIRFLIGICGISTFLIISKSLGSTKIRSSSILGMYSLEMYYIHILVILILEPLFKQVFSCRVFPECLLIIPIFLLIFIISGLIIFLIKTNFVTDSIIFGKFPFLKKLGTTQKQISS